MRPFHLLLCTAILAAPASGQLQAGSRVRIRAAALGARPVVATVVAFEADTLIVNPDGEAAGLIVALDSLTAVDVGHWTTHPVEGALVGLLAGVLVAGMAGPCEYDDCTLGELVLEGTYKLMPDAGTRVTALGGLGLVLGAAVGAAVKTETWRPLVRPGCGGGASTGVGLSFSF